MKNILNDDPESFRENDDLRIKIKYSLKLHLTNIKLINNQSTNNQSTNSNSTNNQST